MNIGNIVTKGLERAKLPVGDFAMREMAVQMLDEIIQEHYESKKWSFRKGVFILPVGSGIEEYALSKYVASWKDIVPHTMRGSNPARKLHFKPSHEFYKSHAYDLESGTPYQFRDGELRGFQTQVSAASTISFVSSLTNYTTGTVSVIYGSMRVAITTGSVTLDMLGRWFRVGTDAKRYKITQIESSSVFYIHAPYEGTTNATASFAIGDVQQKALVSGFLTTGAFHEEEVQLNGATSVSTTLTFATITRISKSDKTYGSVTATSNGGIITNVILDPGETEADFFTVKMYPIPSAAENLEYEALIRHPYLYRNTDSPLFPSQWHPFLALELYIKLMTEWHEKEVSLEVIRRRDNWKNDLYANDNNFDNWEVSQETESISLRQKSNNLPNMFDVSDDDF